MEEQQQQQRKNSRLGTLIIILVILLLLSLTGLAGTLIYKNFAPAGPGSVVVPDNIIAPDESAGKENEGTGEKNADIGSEESTQETGGSTQGSGDHAGTSGEESAADESQSSGQSQGTATGQKPSQSQGRTATALYLYSKNPGDNSPFLATNMFPGDGETRYFCVNVSYEDTVTVKYHGDIQPGSEKLAEVLKCRIVLLTAGQTLYDGLMRDMPASLDHTLTSATETTEELYYEITVYLDTGVGNGYQDRSLTATFRWWVEEEGNLGSSPKTGDDFSSVLWAGLLGISMAALLLLLILRKKEARDGQ